MSITDGINGELKFADTAFKPTAETLRLLYGETWGKGYDMGFDAGYASADAWFVDHADELAEHGWVKLPVDADGKVWHVGDFAVGEVNPKNPKAIERMIWYGPDSGWQLETDTIIYPCPDRPCHHHKPTVEDVLDKFALEIDDARHIPDADDEYARIRAEYAEKLREAVRDA